jgi:hypothetical protein
MAAAAEGAAQGLPEPEVQIAVLEQAAAEAARQAGGAMMRRGLDALEAEYK